jgi:hypothetical protein
VKEKDMVFKLVQQNPPVVYADLDRLEKRFGATLPTEVLSYLRESDGGLPDDKYNYLSESAFPELDEGITVEYLLSANEIEETLEDLGEDWPNEMLPFGDDGNGNYVCIGGLRGKRGIFFWNFETGEFTGPLFSNITEFSKMLGKGPLFEE